MAEAGDSLAIGIAGIGGRMGQQILAQITAATDCHLAVAFDRPDAPDQGAPVGEGAVRVATATADGFARARVVIDFTAPAASLTHANLAASTGTALVIGTTGLNAEQEEGLRAAAEHVPILYAANTSVGITVLTVLVEKLAQSLPDSFDIEVLEMHHGGKRDAPSGTALALGRAAAQGRGRELAEVGRLSREGETGPRADGEIGFATLRGGDVPGEHTVFFAGPGERIEVTHRAADRAIFARGAVQAARWLATQPPGLYSMRDVLGL